VATVQAHAVVERVLSLRRLLVAAVGDPAVGLQEHGRSEVFLAVPPVGWARGAAAGAEDALIQTVELAAVGLGLAVLAALRNLLVSVAGRKCRFWQKLHQLVLRLSAGMA